MENAAADDYTFSGAFADMYLQNAVNLQQVDATNIQDQDLNNFNEQYAANGGESFIEMLGPPPGSPIADSNNADEGDDIELSEQQIDDIECNQFAPKTKKQTTWGVRKFKGICISVISGIKLRNKVPKSHFVSLRKNNKRT